MHSSGRLRDRTISFAAFMVIHVGLVAFYVWRGGTLARTVAALAIGAALAGLGAVIAGRDAGPFWKPSTPREWIGSVVLGVAPFQGLIFGTHWLPPGRTGPPEGHPLETVGERMFFAIFLTVAVAVIVAFERRRERRGARDVNTEAR
jgi:hypothetical protein